MLHQETFHEVLNSFWDLSLFHSSVLFITFPYQGIKPQQVLHMLSIPWLGTILMAIIGHSTDIKNHPGNLISVESPAGWSTDSPGFGFALGKRSWLDAIGNWAEELGCRIRHLGIFPGNPGLEMRKGIREGNSNWHQETLLNHSLQLLRILLTN